jgi:hypothetical protein
MSKHCSFRHIDQIRYSSIIIRFIPSSVVADIEINDKFRLLFLSVFKSLDVSSQDLKSFMK